MGLDRVSDVNVDDIQKRINPKKHYVYRIQVTWDDDAIVPIYRSYDQCLQLQEELKSNKEFLSHLCNQSGRSSSSTFLQGNSFFNKFKQRKHALRQWTLVEEFLKLLVSLSTAASADSDMVNNFFKPLFEDLHSTEGEYEEDIKSNWNRIRMRKSQKNKIYCHNISEPILLEQYVAIEDYPRNKTNDMNLKKGNIVDVIEKNEIGWWFVDLDGYLGWVPASYLIPRDEIEEDPIVETFESGREELYITIQDYEAKHEDEVGFQMGELVLVSQKNQDGWWLIRVRDQKGWAPAMFLREIADSQRQERDPDRSEVLRERMVETVAGLFGNRKTWKPSTRRGLRNSRKTEQSVKRSVMFLKKDPSYVNIKHNDNLEKKQTNKTENLATARKGEAKEDHPSNFMHDNDIYTTAVEACANLSLKKRLKKHQDNQLKIQSTGDDEALGSKVETKAKEATNEEFTPISARPKSHIEVPDTDGQGEKSIKVTASNTFEEPANGINRKTSLGEQSYIAISSYVKEDEDEVNLSEGAPVKILEESDGGWWLVRTKSFSVGWAPSNYLMKSECEIQEDEMIRLKQKSIKPVRPPKTRHVKRMAKECKEENAWLYYQQKQQQQVQEKSASETPASLDGQLPSRERQTTP